MSMADPEHLSNNHRDTLSQLLRHPASHNIEWRAVVSLLEAVADVEEKHDGKLMVSVGGETQLFDRPAHKDIDPQMVVDLRRMLKNAGYGPEAGDVEGDKG